MLRFTLILWLAMMIAAPARSEDMGTQVRDQLISSCKFWGTCGQYFRRHHRPRHVELRAWRQPEERERRDWRDDRYRDDRYSQDCREFVTTVGEERYGRDRAKEAAEQSWMEEVRSRFGARHMDLRNSRGGTWECGRSSTGNRASEKAQDLVGKFLEQCTLRAKPCRAELERVNKD